MKAKARVSITVIMALLLVFAISTQTFATSKIATSVTLTDNLKTVEEVDGGLGEWRYGTGIGFEGLKLVKTAYSDMDHGSKTHRTSCEIDGNYNSSGWVPARTTSRSNTKGNDLESTAYCNWDVK